MISTRSCTKLIAGGLFWMSETSLHWLPFKINVQLLFFFNLYAKCHKRNTHFCLRFTTISDQYNIYFLNFSKWPYMPFLVTKKHFNLFKMVISGHLDIQKPIYLHFMSFQNGNWGHLGCPKTKLYILYIFVKMATILT